MKASDITQLFLHYYQERDFSVLPGSSLLHPSIPMSFVMSAGLPQIETSQSQVGRRLGHKYVFGQRCFRYFDVNTIGSDDLHLSLFEMPAAFSFDALPKAKVLEYLWQLLTSELGIKPANLWVTYFAGGNVSGHQFDADDESYLTWRGLGVPDERIVGLGVDENFWAQGDGIEGEVRYRKLGPSTEVFFDRGETLGCGPACRPPCGCGRFIELANSLFVGMEIDTETGRLRPLSEPFFEAVTGAERLAIISQGKQSVFEIDAMHPIIRAIRRFNYDDGLSRETALASERVIADHLRALCFLVADGAPPPGKDGRQRLIKILIRRVVTHQIILGVESAMFCPTVTAAIVNWHEGCAKLKNTEQTVLSYIEHESQRYRRTVAKGWRRVERLLSENGGKSLTGKQVVDLEKNYGMPSVLVREMLRERGLTFDRTEYKTALRQWRRSLGLEVR